jgi:hypothetical protein
LSRGGKTQAAWATTTKAWMTKHEHTFLQTLIRYRGVILSKAPSLLWDYHSDEELRTGRELKKQVLRYVDQHSRAANLELAYRIAALSRELRDMIYTQTWLIKSPVYRDTRVQLVEDSIPLLHKTCPGPPCRCMQQLPHFVDLNFMGAQVAQEMLLHFPTILTADSLMLPLLNIAASEMKAFMRKDAYHVGITMDTIFKPLDLRLVIGDLHAYGRVREPSSITSCASSPDQIQEAADALMELAGSAGPTGPGVTLKGCVRTITLDLYDYHRTFQKLETLFSVFGPCFVKLHCQGFMTGLDFCVVSKMKYRLGDEAWTWSIERWMEELRFGNEYDWWRMLDARPAIPETQKEIQWQKLRWELIMRHLYQVDILTN